MEWVLFIAPSVLDDAIAGLARDDFPGDAVWRVSPGGGTPEQYYGTAATARGGGDFRRIYWGSEFCESLIPGAGATGRLARAVRGRGLDWTLVTPYVTDHGLDRVGRLLHKLPRELHPDEVVVNDWGVLRMLRREQAHLRPVLGRLMNKMIRDPRVASQFDDPRAPQEALEALRGFSISAGSYRDFLNRRKVGRVEVDNPLQGLAVDFTAQDILASIYLPFGYVTTGRICLPGSLGLPPGEKFSHLGRCGRECGGIVLALKNTRSPFETDRALVLYQRGNAIFYFQPPDRVSAGLEAAAACGVDRVVWQPTLPF
jgi:hypothetical protein